MRLDAAGCGGIRRDSAKLSNRTGPVLPWMLPIR